MSYLGQKYKRRYKRRYKSKGVPVGYPENWKYVGRWKERKLRKGLWGFKFRATKRRKARSYGNFGRGTFGAWDIRAKQYIRKTNKGEYQTHMVGFKRPIFFVVRKPKRRY